jgi:hypothetical protein
VRRRSPGPAGDDAPNDLDQDDPQTAHYLSALDRLGSPRQLALIATGPGALDLSAALTAAHPKARVDWFTDQVVQHKGRLAPLHVHRTVTPALVHRVLARNGRYDAIVEAGLFSAGEQLGLFRTLFDHLRPGGLYLARLPSANPATGAADAGGGAKEDLAAYVTRLAGLDPDDPTEGAAADRASAQAIAAADCDERGVVVTRRTLSLIKVRHTELTAIFNARFGESWGRVLLTVPATRFATSARGTCNDDALMEKLLPPEFDVPALSAYEYHDVVARPRGILVKDDLILPDTFRRWTTGRQRHRNLVDSSRYFVSSDDLQGEADTLEGQFFYLDHEHTHFGHYLTESISRLWAWPDLKRDHPDLKILMHRLLPYQEQVLAYFGIERQDVHLFRRPVRVETLFTAMPAVHIGRYVSPLVTEVYERIANGVPHVASGHELVFLQREPGMWRECLNAEPLEEFFRAQGFFFVRPETLSLPEQAALFRDAKVVAGYIGSQFCGQLFNTGPLDLVGVVNPSYLASNEYLMASALGHRLHQFWGVEPPPTRTHDVQGRALGGMHVDYEFDFERDFGLLRDLVTDLVRPSDGAPPEPA